MKKSTKWRYAAIALILFSCSKHDIICPSKQTDCVAVSYHSGYSGQQFSMTKTLDGQNRVTHIFVNALSNFSHSYEFDYDITYSDNRALLNGTRRLFFYDTNAEPVTKSEEELFSAPLEVLFDPKTKYATSINQLGDNGEAAPLLAMSYANGVLQSVHVYSYSGSPDPYIYIFNVTMDGSGNILSVETDEHAGIRYTYNYSAPAGNYFYEPSQQAVHEWYSFLEALNWGPFNPKNQRATIRTSWGGDPEYNVWTRDITDQQFDATGNLIAYHYGDSVSQHIEWNCLSSAAKK